MHMGLETYHTNTLGFVIVTMIAWWGNEKQVLSSAGSETRRCAVNVAQTRDSIIIQVPKVSGFSINKN